MINNKPDEQGQAQEYKPEEAEPMRDQEIADEQRRTVSPGDLYHAFRQLHGIIGRGESEADHALSLLSGIEEVLDRPGSAHLSTEFAEQRYDAIRRVYDQLLSEENIGLAQAFYEQHEEWLGKTLNPEEIRSSREIRRLREEGDHLRREYYDRAAGLDPVNIMDSRIQRPGNAEVVLSVYRRFPHMLKRDLELNKENGALARAAEYLASEEVDWSSLAANPGFPDELKVKLQNRDRASRAESEAAEAKYREVLLESARKVARGEGFQIATDALALWNGTPERAEFLDQVGQALFEGAEYPSAIRVWGTINHPETRERAEAAIEKIKLEDRDERGKRSRINFVNRWLKKWEAGKGE